MQKGAAPVANNIILIGFMGTGKSTIGRRLAERLKRPFYDLDREIEKLTGMPMLALYQKYGEVRFHAEEDLMFGKLLQKERCVIATGGTLRLSLEDLAKLKQNNTVIALYLEPEIIHRRLKRRNNRPMINRKNMYEDIVTKCRARELLYKNADLCINTTNLTLEKIINLLEERLSAEGKNGVL